MGFTSPYEAGRAIGPPQPVQYMAYQNQIQNQNQIQPIPQQKVTQKPVITLPPKLFDFDPDFFKGVENIEKSEFEGGKSEGQMKNGLLEGKGRTYYDNGEIYEGEWKMINEMEKEYINFQMVMHIKAIGKKTKEMVME